MKLNKNAVKVSPKELSEYFYCTNGVVYWRKNYKRFKFGDLAGCVTGSGYWYIEFKNIRYPRSRIIWCLNNNRWPDEGVVIDHINRDKLDDSIINLRCVSTKENAYNKGAKGYHWDKSRSKWVAMIKTDTKHLFLGRYNTEQEAKEAYTQAKLKYHQIVQTQERSAD
jgi:hypothetical protein